MFKSVSVKLLVLIILIFGCKRHTKVEKPNSPFEMKINDDLYLLGTYTGIEEGSRDHIWYQIYDQRSKEIFNPDTDLFWDLNIDSLKVDKISELGVSFKNGVADSRRLIILCNYENSSKLKNYDDYEVYRDFFKVEKNNHYGLVNYDGIEILAPIYDEIKVDSYVQDTQERLILVKIDDRAGLFDLDGKVLISPFTSKYNDIKPINTGIKIITVNKKKGLMDQNLNEIVPPVCSYMGSNSGNDDSTWYEYSINGREYKMTFKGKF